MMDGQLFELNCRNCREVNYYWNSQKYAERQNVIKLFNFFFRERGKLAAQLILFVRMIDNIWNLFVQVNPYRVV